MIPSEACSKMRTDCEFMVMFIVTAAISFAQSPAAFAGGGAAHQRCFAPAGAYYGAKGLPPGISPNGAKILPSGSSSGSGGLPLIGSMVGAIGSTTSATGAPAGLTGTPSGVNGNSGATLVPFTSASGGTAQPVLVAGGASKSGTLPPGLSARKGLGYIVSSAKTLRQNRKLNGVPPTLYTVSGTQPNSQITADLYARYMANNRNLLSESRSEASPSAFVSAGAGAAYHRAASGLEESSASSSSAAGSAR